MAGWGYLRLTYTFPSWPPSLSPARQTHSRVQVTMARHGPIQRSISPPVPQLIPVVITDVQGDEDGFDNSHNEYTVKLGRELVITGPLPVPDQKFRVPCSMRDTGRTIAAVADVVGGQMTITVTLPELGYWETTAEMLNAGLPQPTFSLTEPIRFVVI